MLLTILFDFFHIPYYVYISFYAEYIERIATSRDPIALHVKLNDLTHNLQRGRAGGHWQQVAKHEPALQRIKEALQSYYNEK